jgi:hypothetical protein
MRNVLRTAFVAYAPRSLTGPHCPMSPSQAISLDFKPVQKPTTQADFTYSITPDTISITDTGKGKSLSHQRH